MKKYIIVPADKVEWVRFDQVFETEPESLRYSLKEYSHEEIIKILEGQEWTSHD